MTISCNAKPEHSKWNRLDCLLLILFLLVAVLSINTVYHTSLQLLDSDTSSELVLAQHLHDTGRIVSSDWFYSTELVVLNSHVILAPLFSLFSDWRKIRFFGVLITHVILLVSFWYLCKSASLKRRSYFLGGTLLLLPTSVAYGRIVLYNFHYAFNVAIGFLLVALTLAFMKDTLKKGNYVWKVAHLSLLLLLSFVSGMSGVRQIAITHVPLLAALVGLWFCSMRNNPEQTKTVYWGAAAVLAACVTFMGGYAINQILAERISFDDYSNTMLFHYFSTRAEEILFAFLHSFGMRREVPLFSLLGILSCLGVATAVVLIGRSLSLLLRKHEMPGNALLVSLVFPAALVVGAFSMLFFSSAYFPTLYVVPYGVWMVPFIAVWLSYPTSARDITYHPAQPVLILFVCLALIGNGLLNTNYFIKPTDRISIQPYEGLGFPDPLRQKRLEPLRALLVDSGFDVGYCTYWEGNILTEMSSGQLTTVPIHFNSSEKGIVYRPFLTSRDKFDIIPQKPFLFIYSEYLETFKATPVYAYANLFWQDDELLCYEFSDPLVLKNYLDKLPS